MAIKCELRYLKGILTHVMFFFMYSNLILTAYYDVDWAFSINDYHTTSLIVCVLGDFLAYNKSKGCC